MCYGSNGTYRSGNATCPRPNRGERGHPLLLFFCPTKRKAVYMRMLCISQGCLVIEINQYSKHQNIQPSVKLLSFEKQTRDHLQIKLKNVLYVKEPWVFINTSLIVLFSGNKTRQLCIDWSFIVDECALGYSSASNGTSKSIS